MTDHNPWAVYIIRDGQGRDYVGPLTRILGEYETEAEAFRVGREYLRTNPGAWLQVATEDGDGRDVEVAS